MPPARRTAAYRSRKARRGEIVAHRAVHHRLGVVDLGLVEHLGVGVVLMHVAHRVEECLLVVLGQRGEHVGELAGLAVEYLALAVYDVFLQIERYRLRGAEIFHGVGNGKPHLLAKTEKWSMAVRAVNITAEKSVMLISAGGIRGHSGLLP